MKFSLKYILFLSLILIIISCNSDNKNNSNNLKNKDVLVIKDYYNIKVGLKEYPKRIVSVSPAITELFYEFESGYKLIGRTDFCNYPKDSVKNIKSIGGINNANIEQIISLHPDLVITSSIFTKKMADVIKGAGIPIISFPEKMNIEGVYETIDILGKILDKKKKADSIINNIKNRLREINHNRELSLGSGSSTKAIRTLPKVYYVIQYGSSGDFSAGKDTYINEIISLAGGDNIAKNTKNWSFSKEQLFANQPDYIFLRKEDSAQFIKTSPYNQLKAVKEKRVYGIESAWMDIQSSRTLLAIDFISKTINRKK